MRKFVDGDMTFSQAVKDMEKPIDIYVEPSHPELMENPLNDRKIYLELQTDKFSGNSSLETLRVKDNELARQILTEKKVNILDDRVKVSPLNSGDLNLLSSGILA
jgi:hypothetical protein